jgi:guanylate kinase
MNKPLYLFVGKSASGKTTIAELLEQKYGYKQVHSYTTRPPRYKGETGHVFVTEEEFDNLGDMAAYTFYNNNHYGTTFKQLETCDIYVIDIPGIETLLQKDKITRPIVIIYFDATVHTRINRMLERHDSDMQIVSRLLQDEQYDWSHKLDALVCHYDRLNNKDIQIYSINANVEQQNVLEMVLYYIKYAEDYGIW